LRLLGFQGGSPFGPDSFGDYTVLHGFKTPKPPDLGWPLKPCEEV
jgi:hypothetical protein